MDTIIKWRKAVDGWAAYVDGHNVKLRQIGMSRAVIGHSTWWLYIDTNRYTPTGNYEDSVHFDSSHQGKRFAEKLFKRGII